MRLKTLLQELVRSTASLDPCCILTQTRVDGGTNTPCPGIPSGRNSDTPASRDGAWISMSWPSSCLGLRALTLKSISVIGG
jgi:hypothetical protein